MKKLVLVSLAIMTTAASALAQSPSPVPYPDGYRSWAHVKSMIIERGHPLFDAFGGIHHLYANAPALRGYRSGKFPDGSVIVFDLLDTTKTADNAIVEGERKVVGVMRKDARKFRSTGGWGYEGFKGDSKTERVVGSNAAAACYGCHEAQKSKDYVFSTVRK